MNTEPPEGDDLQRMLVAMKQNVLERATPRSRRRRIRPGIVIGVVGLLALGTASGAVAVSLSQQDHPVAAPTTREPAPVPSAATPTSAPITMTPTPRPTRNPVATIPTTCREAVPAKDYDRLFGSTPLTEINQAEASTGTDSPDVLWAGTPSLTCVWADPSADVTGLTLDIGTTRPGADPRLVDDSWSCADRDGGRMCQVTTQAGPYPVDQTTTIFIRGDTFVLIRQAAFPTNGLLPAIVEEVWGD